MATFTTQTTCLAMSGGADAVAGVGAHTQLTVSGTWAAGDKITVTFNEAIKLTNGSLDTALFGTGATTSGGTVYANFDMGWGG